MTRAPGLGGAGAALTPDAHRPDAPQSGKGPEPHRHPHQRITGTVGVPVTGADRIVPLPVKGRGGRRGGRAAAAPGHRWPTSTTSVYLGSYGVCL
jgi:hypothetical protein